MDMATIEAAAVEARLGVEEEAAETKARGDALKARYHFANVSISEISSMQEEDLLLTLYTNNIPMDGDCFLVQLREKVLFERGFWAHVYSTSTTKAIVGTVANQDQTPKSVASVLGISIAIPLAKRRTGSSTNDFVGQFRSVPPSKQKQFRCGQRPFNPICLRTLQAGGLGGISAERSLLRR